VAVARNRIKAREWNALMRTGLAHAIHICAALRRFFWRMVCGGPRQGLESIAVFPYRFVYYQRLMKYF
jgi:hypothetical protein